MLSRCGLQYEYRYVMNVVEPPGVAMLRGRAVHKAAEHTLRQKMRSGRTLTHDEIADAARDAIRAEWAQGFRLDEEEAEAGVEATKARAEESTIAMALHYNLTVAPISNPVHVERRFLLELPFSHDLEGVIDLQEQNAIRDLKTGAGVIPNVNQAIQLTAYALAFRVLEGRTPAAVGFDVIFDSKAGGVSHTRLSSTRNREHFDALVVRIARACNLIKAGAFYPCDPSAYPCSPKWCGYWKQCPQGLPNRSLI
jgi:hypothetical protein